MRIHIATDHAGLEFSTQLQHHLAGSGHEVVDHGPIEYDPLDDYPAFCIRAAQAVVRDQEAGHRRRSAIVFGGSGNGEQIAANKVAGIRAALVWSIATAELAREHNDANVIAIGARQHTFDEVTDVHRPLHRDAVLGRGAPRAPHRADRRVRGGRLARARSACERRRARRARRDDSSFDPEAG